MSELGASVELLTGGTGGLGLLTARWLAQHGANGLLLASRSGLLAADGSSAVVSESLQLCACTVLVLVAGLQLWLWVREAVVYSLC